MKPRRNGRGVATIYSPKLTIMKRIEKLYELAREARVEILETMKERNLKEVRFVMSEEEYNKLLESGKETQPYDEYRMDNIPVVTFIDKYDYAIYYEVDTVTTEDFEYFTLHVSSDEYGRETLSEDYITWDTYIDLLYELENALDL